MRTKLLAFAVSSFYCGVAGALYAFAYLGTVEPEAFNLDLLVPHPVHDHHRRAWARSSARSWARPSSCCCPIFLNLLPAAVACAFGIESRLPRCRTWSCMVFGGADHLLPDRRAARPRAALADRQGEAAAVAVPALTGLYWPTPFTEEETRMKRSTLAIAARGARRGGRHPAGGAERAVHPRELLLGRAVRARRLGVRRRHHRLLQPCSTSATAASTASSSPGRNARPSTTTTAASSATSARRSKGPTGATVVHPLSTGITYSLIDKATADKIPVISMGYGRTDAADGARVPVRLPADHQLLVAGHRR